MPHSGLPISIWQQTMTATASKQSCSFSWWKSLSRHSKTLHMPLNASWRILAHVLNPRISSKSSELQRLIRLGHPWQPLSTMTFFPVALSSSLRLHSWNILMSSSCAPALCGPIIKSHLEVAETQSNFTVEASTAVLLSEMAWVLWPLKMKAMDWHCQDICSKVVVWPENFPLLMRGNLFNHVPTPGPKTVCTMVPSVFSLNLGWVNTQKVQHTQKILDQRNGTIDWVLALCLQVLPDLSSNMGVQPKIRAESFICCVHWNSGCLIVLPPQEFQSFEAHFLLSVNVQITVTTVAVAVMARPGHLDARFGYLPHGSSWCQLCHKKQLVASFHTVC